MSETLTPERLAEQLSHKQEMDAAQREIFSELSAYNEPTQWAVSHLIAERAEKNKLLRSLREAREQHSQWCMKTGEDVIADLDYANAQVLALQQHSRELEASLQQAREALRIAEEALRICYNVQEFPGDGSSTQDEALKVVRAALSEKETQ